MSTFCGLSTEWEVQFTGEPTLYENLTLSQVAPSRVIRVAGEQ